MHNHSIFGQMLQLFSRHDFKKCTDRYSGDYYTKKLNCWQQLMLLLYAQAKGLKSLRDIESSIKNYRSRWYHIGIDSACKSTLGDANKLRSADIFRDYFYEFLGKCREISPKHGFKFKNPFYTMDSTLISLCLSIFPWAKYRKQKGALKIHMLLDQNGTIPSFLTVTDGKCHDINIVRDPKYGFPAIEPDSIIAVDRAYIDFRWLSSLDKRGITFVTRAKDNLDYMPAGQHKADKKKGILSDTSITLGGFYSFQTFQSELRLIKYKDKETGKVLMFLTNNFRLSATTIAAIYKARWQIELFFKWIKQNLKIKTFLGTSENAVLTQIWAAMIYYLMLAFIKFQTKYSFSLLDLTRTVKDLLMEPISLIEILRLKYDKFYKPLKPPDIQLAFL